MSCFFYIYIKQNLPIGNGHPVSVPVFTSIHPSSVDVRIRLLGLLSTGVADLLSLHIGPGGGGGSREVCASFAPSSGHIGRPACTGAVPEVVPDDVSVGGAYLDQVYFAVRYSEVTVFRLGEVSYPLFVRHPCLLQEAALEGVLLVRRGPAVRQPWLVGGEHLVDGLHLVPVFHFVQVPHNLLDVVRGVLPLRLSFGEVLVVEAPRGHVHLLAASEHRLVHGPVGEVSLHQRLPERFRVCDDLRRHRLDLPQRLRRLLQQHRLDQVVRRRSDVVDDVRIIDALESRYVCQRQDAVLHLLLWGVGRVHRGGGRCFLSARCLSVLAM